EANEIAKRGIKVKVYFLPREEAMKIPGVVKLAEKMPPELETWRIVEIEGIDIQADGGPHVSNTEEIGNIEVIKVENRGKGKKRLYYTVKP
ncbi:MAG: alanyl-tRNA editing protein AlaX, partial [Metallosphaera sp.]